MASVPTVSVSVASVAIVSVSVLAVSVSIASVVEFSVSAASEVAVSVSTVSVSIISVSVISVFKSSSSPSDALSLACVPVSASTALPVSGSVIAGDDGSATVSVSADSVSGSRSPASGALLSGWLCSLPAGGCPLSSGALSGCAGSMSCPAAVCVSYSASAARAVPAAGSSVTIKAADKITAAALLIRLNPLYCIFFLLIQFRNFTKQTFPCLFYNISWHFSIKFI